MTGFNGQDFNGDAKGDLLWRNDNGSLIEWQMNGSQIASSQYVTLGGSLAAPDASWKIAAVADITGDGKSDMIWRNSVTDQLVEWAMNGAQVTSSQPITIGGVLAAPDASWSIPEPARHIDWQNTTVLTSLVNEQRRANHESHLKHFGLLRIRSMGAQRGAMTRRFGGGRG